MSTSMKLSLVLSSILLGIALPCGVVEPTNESYVQHASWNAYVLALNHFVYFNSAFHELYILISEENENKKPKFSESLGSV